MGSGDTPSAASAYRRHGAAFPSPQPAAQAVPVGNGGPIAL